MAPPKKVASSEMEIIEIAQGEFPMCIVGDSPLVYNALSEKVTWELLLPSGRKTASQKAHSLKHNPIEEYRSSVYAERDSNKGAPTRLIFPAAAFKKAMAAAALDMPSKSSKAQIGRLTWVVGEYVSVYGVPQIYSTVVRMADQARTPDIRTRAILPEWACTFTIRFAEPPLSRTMIFNLMSAAGLICGIGDGRQGKGSLSYGRFRIVNPDDPEFLRIREGGGRQEQDAALKRPEYYDEETARLLTWYDEEVVRRGKAPVKIDDDADAEDELIDA